MTIEIVSASAGSGKTYHLARLLELALREGTARPDAVLVTTFTRAASAELFERVRRRLISSGLHDAARRLGAARIGTVNSLCARLLSDFAFELGLSPRLETIDEETAARMLSEALSAVVGPEQMRELTVLGARIDGFEWEDAVRRVMQLARINAIGPDRLPECARRSLEKYEELLDPLFDGPSYDRQLIEALDRFIEHASGGSALDAQTSKSLALVKRARTRLKRAGGIGWYGYHVLSGFPVAPWLKESADGVRSLAAAHLGHPRLRQDLREATELVFAIAARGLEHYQQFKRERGVIDFEDQESLALELLKIERVRETLADELDLVLVDEFQDTTPIQLALFLRLARLARRSVWVGDQKQAIYGFRGSDPALMDRAVSEISRDREPETLTRSWRSRPLLVEVTSSLFAAAFSAHGVPPQRVALEAACVEPPEGLGPAFEYWELNAKSWEKQAAALASALDQLLDDPSVRVRCPLSGEPRPLRPGDVAVLCQTNQMCALVAAALSQRGFAVDHERAGLLSTIEGRVLRAGLQLWLDPYDRLARETIARILDTPDDADAWLAGAARSQGGAEVPEARGWALRLLARRAAHPAASLGEIVHHTASALELERWAHAVADAPVRLANLDAFRALVERYLERESIRGGVATLRGLLDDLEGAAADGRDTQGASDDVEAIRVLTWHRAKGLEWPVTVLFQLEREGFVDPFDVQIVGDAATIDLDDPLRGLEIRYWPRLYPRRVRSTVLDPRVEQHALYRALSEREERQRLRLLYVGWTRARDRLVLCGSANLFWEGMIPLLRSAEGARLLSRPNQGRASWGGIEIDVPIRRFVSSAPRAIQRLRPAWVVPPPRREHPLLFRNPSAIEAQGEVVRVVELGEALNARGAIDPDRFGEMVHAFLAARLLQGSTCADQLAERTLRGFEMAALVDPAVLTLVADRFEAFIAREHPGAQCRVEVPLRAREPDGGVVSGTADLLLDLGSRAALVDHKTFGGRRDAALAHARTHLGQLRAYAEVLSRALSKPVEPWYIHMPMAGLLVQVAPLAREPVQQLLAL